MKPHDLGNVANGVIVKAADHTVSSSIGGSWIGYEKSVPNSNRFSDTSSLLNALPRSRAG